MHISQVVVSDDVTTEIVRNVAADINNEKKVGVRLLWKVSQPVLRNEPASP